MKLRTIKTKEHGNLLSIQWDGLTLPSEYEEFSDFGYFEDDNGYDLESCDIDFEIEPKRNHKVRLGDYILKRLSDGKFTNVSKDFFNKNLMGLI